MSMSQVMKADVEKTSLGHHFDEGVAETTRINRPPIRVAKHQVGVGALSSKLPRLLFLFCPVLT